MTVGLAGGNLRTEYGAPAPPESCPGIAEDPGLQGTRRLHPLGDRRPLACGAVNGHRRDRSTRQISESRLAADRQFGKRRTQEHSVRGFGRFDATGRRSSSHQRSACLRGTPGRVDSSPSSQREIEIADRTPAREWCRRGRKNNAIQNRPTATRAGADHRDTRCGGPAPAPAAAEARHEQPEEPFEPWEPFELPEAAEQETDRWEPVADTAAHALPEPEPEPTEVPAVEVSGESGCFRGVARTTRGAFRAMGAVRAAGG